MDLDIDSGTVLYGIGVVLAVAALLYFARDLVFDLSITVKALLLFFAFVAFFVVGAAVERETLDVVAFALSGTSYVVFLGYTVTSYRLGDTGVFVALAVSSGLFVGLGYLLRERGVTLPVRTALTVVAAFALVGLVLGGLDATVGGVTYDVSMAETATIDSGIERTSATTVGQLTATNQFVFTRQVETPWPDGCLYAANGTQLERVYVDVQFQRSGTDERPPEIIGGSESITMDIVARTHSEPEGPQIDGTYTIERADTCPVSADGRTLVVTFDDPGVD